MQQIWHYLDPNDRDHLAEWRDQVRDTKARIAINRRIMCLELDNFGNHEPLRRSVQGLRIDVGTGYRIYYAKADATVMLLLCGGDKRRQSADIDRACACWRDWQNRTGD